MLDLKINCNHIEKITDNSKGLSVSLIGIDYQEIATSIENEKDLFQILQLININKLNKIIKELKK